MRFYMIYSVVYSVYSVIDRRMSKCTCWSKKKDILALSPIVLKNPPWGLFLYPGVRKG